MGLLYYTPTNNFLNMFLFPFDGTGFVLVVIMGHTDNEKLWHEPRATVI